MLYRKTLHQAWKTVWENKYFWFFGLFAALLGVGSSSEAVFKIFNQQAENGVFSSFQLFAKTGIFSLVAVKNFFGLIFTDLLSFFILAIVFLIMLILGGFLLWLSVVSQAALVSNSAKTATNKKHNFKDGLEIGIKNFWPVLGLNAVLKIFIFFGATLITLPVLINASRIGLMAANLFFIVLFLIFLPIVFVLSLTVRYAVCFLVIKKSNWQLAFKQGWDLFVRNWLVNLEMAAILFLVNLVVGVALILLFLILSVPILFIALFLAKITFLLIFWLVVVGAGLLFFFFIIFVGAILSAFQIASWTSLFIQLSGKGGVSKLVRVFEKRK